MRMLLLVCHLSTSMLQMLTLGYLMLTDTLQISECFYDVTLQCTECLYTYEFIYNLQCSECLYTYDFIAYRVPTM